MHNKMLIRTEMQQNEYADLAGLYDIDEDKVIKYFLTVNDEEVEITSTMAAGIAYFFDEYNQEVCKIDKCYCIGTWKCPQHE